MSNKNMFMTWIEKLWGAVFVVNILATITGFPYGLGYFALGMGEQSQKCYDSGMFNIITIAPLAIAFSSIFVLILSRKSHLSGNHIKALALASLPIIAFIGHYLLYRLSPCG